MENLILVRFDGEDPMFITDDVSNMEFKIKQHIKAFYKLDAVVTYKTLVMTNGDEHQYWEVMCENGHVNNVCIELLPLIK